MRELPLRELMEKLSHFDEMTILELLNIDSEKLVELMQDEIEAQYESLLHKLDEEDY